MNPCIIQEVRKWKVIFAIMKVCRWVPCLLFLCRGSLTRQWNSLKFLLLEQKICNATFYIIKFNNIYMFRNNVISLWFVKLFYCYWSVGQYKYTIEIQLKEIELTVGSWKFELHAIMNICPISLRMQSSHGFATNICLIPLNVQRNPRFAKIVFFIFSMWGFCSKCMHLVKS
jgi:hypothetical protein